jgi:hypothetical protein
MAFSRGLVGDEISTVRAHVALSPQCPYCRERLIRTVLSRGAEMAYRLAAAISSATDGSGVGTILERDRPRGSNLREE